MPSDTIRSGQRTDDIDNGYHFPPCRLPDFSQVKYYKNTCDQNNKVFIDVFVHAPAGEG